MFEAKTSRTPKFSISKQVQQPLPKNQFYDRFGKLEL